MDYTVSKGERTATVLLDGGERKIVFDSRYNVFSVSAENDVLVALESGKAEGDDGVMLCRGGESVMYPHMKNLDSLYITGSGTVRVFASNVAVNPFKKITKGGGANGISKEDTVRLAMVLKSAGYDIGVSASLDECIQIIKNNSQYDFYVDYSGEILRYSGRSITRSTELPAYCAYFWLAEGKWFAPCVISEYEEAVTYKMYVADYTSMGSVEYGGKVWYYNFQNGGSYQNAKDGSLYNRYFMGEYTKLQQDELAPIFDLLEIIYALGEVKNG